ncbi:hypothetical protein MTP99_001985 [Tenebrio molitor]|nr:hypothetical protein MTP99_001985 [Tenebrio molitor]
MTLGARLLRLYARRHDDRLNDNSYKTITTFLCSLYTVQAFSGKDEARFTCPILHNPAGDKLTSTFATCLGKIHLSDLAQPAKQNVCTNVENYDSSVPAFNKSYVGWMHPGAPGFVLNHNMSGRIIHSNQSLVLQKVTRQSAGRYVCSVVNSEGERSSNELNFRVQYAPTCKYEKIMVVGASRGESVDIVCEIEADPPAKSYRWKFNNSGETLDVAAERFAKTSNGTLSVLRYTPVSELDYGSLSCWAINSVGHQVNPCVFQVVAAGKPFPVRNCSLSNQTSSSVEVICLAGFDGGLPQHFLLELYSSSSAVPRYNMTAINEPYFFLDNLEPDVTFRIVVFAVNAKGRSHGVVLEEVTFRDAEKRTGKKLGKLGFVFLKV